MNIKTIVLSSLFALLLSCGTEKKQSCEYFHEGTFVYAEGNLLYDEIKDFKIVRTNNLQIEFNPKTGDSTISKITWIDECTYKMELMDQNNSPEHSVKEITAKITPENDSSYIFKSEFNGFVLEGKMIKIN